jgi:hypothetical protein
MGWFDWLKSKQAPSGPTEADETKLRYLNLRELAEENDDLIKGWRLSVTMNLETPLEWLERHDERANKPSEVPAQFAIWTPALRSFRELGFDVDEVPEGTMASAIGQIPVQGGDFLDFLKMYREMVEADVSDDIRLSALSTLDEKYPDITNKLGGNLVELFCVKELQNKLFCGHAVASKLFHDGLRTPSQVQKASLERLCSIKGIGKAKAEKLLA